MEVDGAVSVVHTVLVSSAMQLEGEGAKEPVRLSSVSSSSSSSRRGERRVFSVMCCRLYGLVCVFVRAYVYTSGGVSGPAKLQTNIDLEILHILKM